MAPTPEKPKLLVIVGPTASGKSALALKIAKKFNGEIIAADSRTIYKGRDIGTAKPSREEQKMVTHWGLDLIEPGQKFSAAEFKDYAADKIADIQDRGKLPIVVGGTGLYIDGLLFDFSFRKASNLRRFIYSAWSIERLQKLISQRDWPMPENRNNKRHLISAIERRGLAGSKQLNLPPGTLLIGLIPADDIIRQRINSRINEGFKGVVTETKALLKKYGDKKLKRTGGIAYKFSLMFIKNQITEPEAKELIQKEEWQYARRQKTWFRRNKFIQWYDNEQSAITSVAELLNK